MADIDIRRTHDLGLEAARAAAGQMVEHLGKKFDLRGAWDGDVLRFERPGVKGSLAISARDLRLTVSLGFLLSAMRGPIEAAILRELDELFARHQAKPAAEGTKSKKAPGSPKKGA